MTLARSREEAASRLRQWHDDKLQRRKFALLVAGYCRQRFEHRWGDRRRALLVAAEQVGGRQFPPERTNELRALARHLLDRANWSLAVERDATDNGRAVPNRVPEALPEPDEHEAVRLLGLSFDDPERAAGELVASPLSDPHLLLRVMECLRPIEWEATSEWFTTELPRDAHKLARHAYDTSDYSSLAVLADRLEGADCPDRLLLNHCRCGYRHVRGCAAVDRLCGYKT